MNLTSPLFKRYVKFVLSWEGGKSNDTNDTASKCAPWYGAYHTNMGVTFCTYQQYAPIFGLDPSYQGFLNMTPDDVSQFIYQYYWSVSGGNLPDKLAIALTETAWGSGSSKAIKTLQEVLNEMGQSLDVDGIIGSETLQAINNVNQETLYRNYITQRKSDLLYLSSLPQYSMYRKGWINRVNDFITRFPYLSLTPIILFLGLFFLINSKKTKGKRRIT